MSIKEIAQQYITDGWNVVPLVKGEKRADTKWQKRTYKAEDFKDDSGIAGKCGEPSGWRVDVDLDHPIAIEVAPMLLPRTGMIHGRPGKPDSHYWYICENIKTKQFTGLPQADGSKQMLVELRSTGGYTAIPPSGHPSGDTLAWSVQRDMLRIGEDELLQAVRHVAIATLWAIHYPGPGARHAAAGYMAAFLCKHGINPVIVIRIMEAAGKAAKDSDLQDRMNFVRSTVAKYQEDNDAALAGGPKLAEIIGQDVVNKLRSWLGVADNDYIEQMNSKHFVVRIGRDTVIGREDASDGHVVFQQPKALYTEYANVHVKVGEKTDKKSGESTDVMKPLFQAWLESKMRRGYDEVVFCPPPNTPRENDYNLWKGFAVTPAEGDCSRYLSHVFKVICGANEEYYAYLINLLAFTVQQPGVPSGVAVVLRGEQGTGKGIFVRTFGELFGRHFIQLDNTKHLVGGFNAAISGKIVVFADEALWAGDKREVGALKRLITEPTLTIERKGIDASSEPNYVHLFMATNEEWAIPAGLQERRFFALKVSSAHIQDHAYFQALRHEIENGGRAALLHFLLQHPVDYALLKRAPRTEELRVQQSQSLPQELQWWQDCLYDARIGALLWTPGTWIPCAVLYTQYAEWADKHRARLLSNVEFGRRLSDFISSGPTKPRKVNGETVRALQLRDLDDARKFFDTRLTTSTEWPNFTAATQQPLPNEPPPF